MCPLGVPKVRTVIYGTVEPDSLRLSSVLLFLFFLDSLRVLCVCLLSDNFDESKFVYHGKYSFFTTEVPISTPGSPVSESDVF